MSNKLGIASSNEAISKLAVASYKLNIELQLKNFSSKTLKLSVAFASRICNGHVIKIFGRH